MRDKIYNEATIEIFVSPEDMPVRGNYIVGGDDAYDKKQEDKIIAASEWNEWAWCVVEVRGTWNGLQTSSYLGGCSYDSEKEFREDDNFCSMRMEVCEELTKLAQKIVNSATNG